MKNKFAWWLMTVIPQGILLIIVGYLLKWVFPAWSTLTLCIVTYFSTLVLSIILGACIFIGMYKFMSRK